MGLKKLNAIPLLLAMLALTAGIALYAFAFPLYSQYFPKCLFYKFTGLYCPVCGTQRAITSMLHGDIFLALHDNLVAVLAMPFIGYACITYYFEIKEAKRKSNLFYNSPLFAKSIVLTLVLFGIARNIPLYPFSLLAPLN